MDLKVKHFNWLLSYSGDAVETAGGPPLKAALMASLDPI